MNNISHNMPSPEDLDYRLAKETCATDLHLSPDYLEALGKVEGLFLSHQQVANLDHLPAALADCFRPLSISKQKALALHMLVTNCTTKTNWVYGNIIKALVLIHPDLENLIYSADTDKHALSLAGLRIVFDYLVRKGSITLPCSLCDNYEEMITAINHFCSTAQNGAHSTIIARRDDYAHMMPLYLERRDGVVHIVITDSKGCKDPRAREQEHALETAKIIRDQITTPSYQMHLYHTMRQHHLYCAAFALRDVVGFSKTPDFLQFVLDSEWTHPVSRDLMRELQQEIPNAQLFQDIPRRMFKIVQSFQALQDYDNKQEKGTQSLSEELGERRIIQVRARGEDRRVNNLVKERFLKYERIVIARALTEKMSREQP